MKQDEFYENFDEKLYKIFIEVLEASIKRYTDKSNRNKEELLEKHKKILEIKAKEYTWKGNRKGNPDYEYWFNESCYILLREFYANPFITSKKVKNVLDHWLRDIERKLFEKPREEEKPYGLDPGSLWSDWEENPETEAQKAHYKEAKKKADKEEQEALEALGLLEALERLEEREKVILVLYYYNSCKLKEIANYYNISIPMVSKIKKRAEEKVKRDLERRGLDRGFFFPVGKKFYREIRGNPKTRNPYKS